MDFISLFSIVFLAIGIADCSVGLQYPEELPIHTIPISYSISIITGIARNDTKFNGEVVTELKVLNETSSLILHTKDLLINEQDTILIDESSHLYRPQKHTFELEAEIMEILFDRILYPGLYKLKLTYNGTLRNESGGFFKTSYVDDKGVERFLVATDFVTNFARYAFPCWDELKYRAVFNISLKYGKNYQAVSNMPIERETVDGDEKTTEFQSTPQMPAYLVTFVVSDFSNATNEFHNFTIWAPTHLLSRATFTDVGMKILGALENYTGVAFPLPKLDLVLIPKVPWITRGNWGIVMYQYPLPLVDDNVMTTQVQYRRIMSLAHEFSHQWFGGLVGIEQWNMEWLKEGVAEFLQYYILDKVEPHTWEAMKYFVVQNIQLKALKDDGIDERPMNDAPKVLGDNPINVIPFEKGTRLEILLGATGVQVGGIQVQGLLWRSRGQVKSQTLGPDLTLPKIKLGRLEWPQLELSINFHTGCTIFIVLTILIWEFLYTIDIFQPAASVIYMMWCTLSDKVFQQGLRFYLEENAYKATNSDILLESLQKAVNENSDMFGNDFDFKEYMDPWLNQAGFPMIQVDTNVINNTITISQERFFTKNRKNLIDHDNIQWFIPLNFATGDKPDFNNTMATKWLKPEEKLQLDVDLNNTWIIFNLQHSGYYRVNYDERNWRLLIEQLNNDHTIIHEINRAQLIADCLYMAMAGKIHTSIVLDLLNYLTKEKDNIPWLAFFSNFFSWFKTYKGNPGKFLKSFVSPKVKNYIEFLKYEPQIEDDRMTQLLRPRALSLACSTGVKSCHEFVTRKLRTWLNNPSEKSIPVDLFEGVLCSGLRIGDFDVGRDVYRELQQPDGPYDKQLMNDVYTSCSFWIP